MLSDILDVKQTRTQLLFFMKAHGNVVPTEDLLSYMTHENEVLTRSPGEKDAKREAIRRHLRELRETGKIEEFAPHWIRLNASLPIQLKYQSGWVSYLPGAIGLATAAVIVELVTQGLTPILFVLSGALIVMIVQMVDDVIHTY